MMSNTKNTTVFDHVELATADLSAVHGGQSWEEVPDPEQRTPMPSRRSRDPEPEQDPRHDRGGNPRRPRFGDFWDRFTKTPVDRDPPHSGGF